MPWPLRSGARVFRRCLSAMDRRSIQPVPSSPRWRRGYDYRLCMGYNLPDAYRQTARLVVRLLKGDRPADLPFELPARYELIVNLKAAKAIGLTIPDSFVLLADEVIEWDGASSYRCSAVRRRGRSRQERSSRKCKSTPPIAPEPTYDHPTRAAAGSFTLRLRANHRASLCVPLPGVPAPNRRRDQ